MVKRTGSPETLKRSSAPAKSGATKAARRADISVAKTASLGLGSLISAFRTPKTAEIIARHFRQKIISGELPAGSRLPVEPELMQELGVSRTILREALRILESESLLQVSRGSRNGAVILRPDLRLWANYANLLLQLNEVTVADVYEARQGIESIAAGLLAANASPDTIRRLEEALAAEAEALRMGAEAYLRPSADFHGLVSELCGNKTLAIFVGTLNEIIKRQLVAERLPDNPDQMLNSERAHRAHAKLIEYVRAGDAVNAVALWRSHHEGAAKVILRDHGDATVQDLMSH